jgi:hypothetical protein
LPDRPRTDPGVQFSRTGFFNNPRFRQGSARSCRQSHPWSYPWLGYLEVFQQLTEGFPTITLPLTRPVEPLSENPHCFTKELLQTRVVAADSIVVIVVGSQNPVTFCNQQLAIWSSSGIDL